MGVGENGGREMGDKASLNNPYEEFSCKAEWSDGTVTGKGCGV